MKNSFVAHYRSRDDKIQTVCEHLIGVSSICKQLTAKIGLSEAGELLGLLHDIGKYSTDFQNYIKTETGLLNPDIDDTDADAKSLKGKIDHSTAGAQWIWQRFSRFGLQGKLVGQILAVCLSSHHGGMIDCLRIEGENGFLKRIQKSDVLTHLQICLETADLKIKDAIEHVATEDFLKQILQKIICIVSPGEQEPNRLKHFRLGFFTRFLFSCLIDADRIDSADFECPENNKFRTKKN